MPTSMEEQNRTSAQGAPEQPENVWLSLLFNIFIPAMLLIRGNSWLGLEPIPVLMIALAFPVTYGIFDFIRRRKFNFISALGFVSILLTGGIGLLRLDKDWIAVKEAAVPGIIAILILVSLKTRFPLVRTLLYNPRIFRVDAITEELRKRQNEPAFERLMTFCTLVLSASFFLSAFLNYVLARIIIQSDSGTEAFNAELGRLALWSYPVIVVPSMAVMVFALWKLIAGIRNMTGLTLEELMNAPPEDKDKKDSTPHAESKDSGER